MSDQTDQPAEQPKVEVRRMPVDREAGPFYPSGMSAPEAAMAGAVDPEASDREKEVIEKLREEYGIEAAS